VATLALDRPERLNAISAAMLDGISRALRAAHEDPEVRVRVLTGRARDSAPGSMCRRRRPSRSDA
jgi:enoyl-CoA hydratase/carnithine racemase